MPVRGFHTPRVQRTLEDLKRSYNLPTTSEQGVSLYFYEDDLGTIRQLIEVGENTSKEDMEKSWPLIAEWRKRLTEYQGQRTQGRLWRD